MPSAGSPWKRGEAGVILGGCLAVLPGGVLLGGGDQPAQAVGHQLAAIANAQNGDAPSENVRVHVGRSVQVYAVGPPGKNDTDGIQGFQLCQRCGVGFDFAVNPALPTRRAMSWLYCPPKSRTRTSSCFMGRPPFSLVFSEVCCSQRQCLPLFYPLPGGKTSPAVGFSLGIIAFPLGDTRQSVACTKRGEACDDRRHPHHHSVSLDHCWHPPHGQTADWRVGTVGTGPVSDHRRPGRCAHAGLWHTADYGG